jgi:hypothetical protein
LVAISAPPVYEWAGEVLAQREFARRYRVSSVQTEELSDAVTDADRARTGWPTPAKTALRFARSAALVYDPLGGPAPDPEAVRGRHAGKDVPDTGRIQIWIDDTNRSLETPVEIRTQWRDLARYHLWLSAAVIEDRLERWQALAILQRVDPLLGQAGAWGGRKRAWRFRLLLVNGDGSVRQEEFGFDDRRRTLWRAFLVSRTVPGGTGLYQDSVSWVSCFAFVYPLGSGVVGVLLILSWLGGLAWHAARRSGGQSA